MITFMDEAVVSPGHRCYGHRQWWALSSGGCYRSPRGRVARLLGTHYTPSQMTYDFRRLHGLMQRIPGTNTYTITPTGIRAAVFYTKLHAPNP